METIIEFLTSNKAMLGVIVSIGEGIVVLINLWRKFREKNSMGILKLSHLRLKSKLLYGS